MKIKAIVPAAGLGSRFDKDKNKLLEKINDVPLIVYTLRALASVDMIDEIIICASKNLIPEIGKLVNTYKIPKVKKIIKGGKTRQESVFNGLKAIDTKVDYVLIHDAARPLITPDIINSAIKQAADKGASIVAVTPKDTIKRLDKAAGKISQTYERSELLNVQTPQIFKFLDILVAHRKFEKQNFTDDSAMIEKLGIPVFVTVGSYKNIKITTKEDLKIAELFITPL